MVKGNPVRTLLSISAALLLSAGIAGCSTHTVDLAYDPAKAGPALSRAAAPSATIVAVTDERKNPPNELGAIRGGFGNALKTLESPVPVKDVVATAFTSGMKARNLWAADGRFGLAITIAKFDCSQYVRREAHAVIAIAVTDRTSGRPVFDHVYEENEVNGQFGFDNGIFGSVDDLRQIADDTLQAVVDKALDDPALRRALETTPAASRR